MAWCFGCKLLWKWIVFTVPICIREKMALIMDTDGLWLLGFNSPWFQENPTIRYQAQVCEASCSWCCCAALVWSVLAVSLCALGVERWSAKQSEAGSGLEEVGLLVSPDWAGNEDKWGAPVNESSSRKAGSSQGESVTSPREGPRIRNFLVCVFLAQVKWIAPISVLRGQLHYMKETVTLNVTVQQPLNATVSPREGGWQ